MGNSTDPEPSQTPSWNRIVLRLTSCLIDFGQDLGIKKSLAKLAPNYEGSEVVGTFVLAVVNSPPRQIGKHQSVVLTLGVPDEVGNVVLVRPDADVPLGGRLY